MEIPFNFRGEILELALTVVAEELGLHLVGRVIGTQYVAIGNKKVHGSIQIVVETDRAESERLIAGSRHIARLAFVSEDQAAPVAVERILVGVEVGQKNVGQSVRIEVTRRDAHTGFGLTDIACSGA